MVEYIPKNPRRLRRRYFYDILLRGTGILAITTPLLVLTMLFASTINTGFPAFFTTRIYTPVYFDSSRADALENDPFSFVYASMSAAFPALDDTDLLSMFAHSSEDTLISFVKEHTPEALIGSRVHLWLKASSFVDAHMHNADDGMLSEGMRATLEKLKAQGAIKTSFDFGFFTRPDSRFPEDAGIGAALLGTLYIMVLTIVFSFFIGVATAIYLEEFSKRTLFTSFLEVNINNLGAVPSIVFGLLGLAVFISVFHIPRSTPLLAAIVLSLMTLPTIIITSRLALRSVPRDIYESAFSLGATKIQVVFHHVVPMAFPGILTGVILAIARAIGETAPLLMIGMVAFIPNLPHGFLSPSVSLPVQIYLWSGIPEPAYVAKASATILVLLLLLLLMNTLAIYLRIRFERKN